MTFLLIYGGMHAYVFWKVHRAFPERVTAQVVFAVFLLLMLFAPLLARRAETAGHDFLAAALAWTGYVWMGVILWLVSLGIVSELWNAAAGLASARWPSASRWMLAPRTVLGISGIAVAVACVWGTIEARSVRLVEKRIRTDRLPVGSAPVRMAVISDVHLSHLVRKARLRRILDRVAEAKPDLLVSLGDLNDHRRIRKAESEAAMLAAMTPRLGKYGVAGNHEFYVGMETSRAFHDLAGIRLLREESLVLDGRIRLCGVDDPAGRLRGELSLTNENKALPAERDGMFTILLKHRPNIRQTSVGRFDLQLSGHVHGGQMFPFMYYVYTVHPIWPGMHALDKGSRIYVSRGAGTWGPPFRLLAPPEVTLIVIEPEEGRSEASGSQ